MTQMIPTTPPRPSVGRIVHYVSYGTPGGEYTSQCRAAQVTEVAAEDPMWIGVAVMNPTGLFFRPLCDGGCEYDELPPPGKIVAGERAVHRGGTWHWPERVE